MEADQANVPQLGKSLIVGDFVLPLLLEWCNSQLLHVKNVTLALLFFKKMYVCSPQGVNPLYSTRQTVWGVLSPVVTHIQWVSKV